MFFKNTLYIEFMPATITYFFLAIILNVSQLIYSTPIAEQFRQVGYVEICNMNDDPTTFDSLYVCFDELIEFLQKNPVWSQKLFSAKERFIRSKERNYYSTDFFGFYDELQNEGRSQISFYYSIDFHKYISAQYPELNKLVQISSFFDACFKIYQRYRHLFDDAVSELELETIFASECGQIPILIKLVKYYPSYKPTRPHYDGTAFSLFLHSTDNQSLLISPYKSTIAVEDFFQPLRGFCPLQGHNSILLIPGALLAEFSIYPTPHIVVESGKTRYATIAFAMRPGYTHRKIELSSLPNFRY